MPQMDNFFSASGGIYSTVSDYAKFLQMWMDYGQYGKEHILKDSTVRKALHKYDQVGREDIGSRMHWEIYNEQDKSDSLPAFGHGGSDGTYSIAIPAKNLMILFFTQTRGNIAIGSELVPIIRRLFL